MTDVLFLVAFYGFRCIGNIAQLRRVCKSLRDRIDRDIFKEVIVLNHVTTRKYNKIQTARCLFPNANVLNSLKPGESFHLLFSEYDSLNVHEDEFCWNTYYVNIDDGQLICSLQITDYNFGSVDIPGFCVEYKRFPDNTPWDTKKISLFARKKAKIQ